MKDIAGIEGIEGAGGNVSLAMGGVVGKQCWPSRQMLPMWP